MALMMAACSNNDDNEILQNTQQPGTMHFTATIAAPSGDATTRTVYTEDGATIKVEWAVDDQIALVHNGVKDVARVTAVDGSGNATIEATITGSPADDDDVYLAYPANAVESAEPELPFPFTPNQDIFDNVKNYQDGTLAYIQDNLDLRMGSGKLAVSGDKVTLKGSVSVSSLICIWKLTLQDESSNTLSATQLTFKNNTYTQAKATSAAKSEYYLCVVPRFIPDPSGTFSFEATVGGDTYTFSKTGLSLTAGKYYQSTVKMTRQAALGDLFYSDGTFSSTLVAGKTPIGVIAYLDQPGTDDDEITEKSQGAGHGLVLCLKNAASGIVWSTNTSSQAYTGNAFVTNVAGLKRSEGVSGYSATAALATDATTYPAAAAAKNYTILTAPKGTTGWFLPSAQQWVKMMEGLGELAESTITWGEWFDNSHTAADKWEAALSKAGSGNYDSMTSEWLCYWSSSERSAFGALGLDVEPTGTGSGYGFSWSPNSKDDDNHRVRPVLAF